MNDYELLSKAQVVREYGFPEHQLDADLRAGKIPYFTSSGERVTDGNGYRFLGVRYYLPRYGVEQRIEELARGEAAS